MLVHFQKPGNQIFRCNITLGNLESSIKGVRDYVKEGAIKHGTHEIHAMDAREKQ